MKKQLVERLTKLLNDLPDEEEIKFSIERGKDEVIFRKPPEQSLREFRPNRGITITINIAGGARDGVKNE